ncbi:hypothetical protein [Curtobacterium sp. Leaf261]|uniref:hypothetical protein n=1 Tax=Curtobacterium sp. Leaf261 TaxID=1736311 RepID=UPI0007011799|nr:hypothetical protein [Curtobacterium sp. Leaf261]KQO63713.1 hypothetical protein ASF23_05700 [Curtobacterium sp. Leaf261]
MSTRNPLLEAQRAGEQMAATAFGRLSLPDTLTVSSIVDHVAGVRRRPITIVELPTLAGTSICGWWNAREDDDEILIAPPRSERHRDALVLHEVGHLVLDHAGVARASDNIAATLGAAGPGGRSEAERAADTAADARAQFHDATEIAAELLADALARAIRQGPPRLSRFLSVFS